MDIAPADQTAVEAMWASYVADSGTTDRRPLAIVRTTDVRAGPLWSADDRFAWDEGEGDRTRAWWLDAHTRFFSRQCTAMGLTFSDDIGVVFERFELAWPTIRT